MKKFISTLLTAATLSVAATSAFAGDNIINMQWPSGARTVTYSELLFLEDENGNTLMTLSDFCELNNITSSNCVPGATIKAGDRFKLQT